MIGLEHDLLREHQLHSAQQRLLAAVACTSASAPPGALNPTRQRSALTRPDFKVIEPSPLSAGLPIDLDPLPFARLESCCVILPTSTGRLLPSICPTVPGRPGR